MKRPRNPLHPEQTDYVPLGSVEHAQLIGLRNWVAGDPDWLTVEANKESWTLMDITAFGAFATKDYLTAVLRQKVSALTAKPPVVQSKDPLAPNYAMPAYNPEVG